MSVAFTRPLYFANRADAARKLAAALSAYRRWHPLVLAIPRGGVPIGGLLADKLGGELDVVLVHKLRAPHNPELAIGSVDESGHIDLAGYAATVGADASYVQREAAQQWRVIRERRMRYGREHARADAAGRVVIVVDDGMATGATMRAALHSVRSLGPEKLVCALPVASPRALASLQGMADDTVCLSAPETFRSVGQFYGHFPAVDDEQVLDLLALQPLPPGGGAGSASARAAGVGHC